MPKGVEHYQWAQNQYNQAGVKGSVMPKGVEHNIGAAMMGLPNA